MSFDYINNLTSIKYTGPFQINFNNNNLNYTSLIYYLCNTIDLNGGEF